MITWVIPVVLVLTSWGQTIAHPELSEPFGTTQIEAYQPAPGPDCDWDQFSARSGCSR